MKSCLLWQDGPWGHYAKWNKSDREKYYWSHWYVESKNQTSKFVDSEKKKIVVARGMGWVKWVKRINRVQTSSFKISRVTIVYTK